ncbi:MAG TPA: HAD-IA family hydrolase [Burkholderiaceae bacterium]
MKRLKHAGQPLWLFDLDNTLHDASHAIFPAIKANMNTYIGQVLMRDAQDSAAIGDDDINEVRLRYWRRYGATLLGMMRHHGVRADEFLHHAHTFENLPTMIRRERGLVKLLSRLPGRKILLTNAPRRYSRDVLRHIGLHKHFARHIAIEQMHVHRQLRPKPSTLMLRKLLAREGVHPTRAVLVEDTVETLKAAKTLGVRTVWITGYLSGSDSMRRRIDGLANPGIRRGTAPPCINRPAYVDVKVKSVLQLPRRLARLR